MTMHMDDFRLDISLAVVMILLCTAVHTSRVENTVGGWASKENRKGAIHQSCFPTSNDLILSFPTSSRSSEVECLASKQLANVHCEKIHKRLPTINITGKKEKGVFPYWQVTLYKGSVKTKTFFFPWPSSLHMCAVNVDWLSGPKYKTLWVELLNTQSTKGEVHLKSFYMVSISLCGHISLL